MPPTWEINVEYTAQIVLKRINRRLPEDEQVLTLRTANSAAIGWVLSKGGSTVRLLDLALLEGLAKELGAIEQGDRVVSPARKPPRRRPVEAARDFAITLVNLCDDLSPETRIEIFGLAVQAAPQLAKHLAPEALQSR